MLIQSGLGPAPLRPAQAGVEPSNRQNLLVRFGCRMMAFMTEGQAGPENYKHRLHCLSTAENSLQNLAKPNQKRDGVNHVFTVENLSGMYEKHGQPDGGGIAAFIPGEKRPQVMKGHESAFLKDSTFAKALRDLLPKNPQTLLAHIRLASPDCRPVQHQNTHPFTYGPWALMHNGYYSGFRTIQDRIDTHYKPLLGEGPKGNTDSEAALYLFAGKLMERYGTVELSDGKFSTQDLQQVFAETINELIEATGDTQRELSGHFYGIKGEMDTSGYNFVLSNGQVTLAYCQGPKLFLGMKTLSNGKTEYVLSSEPVQQNPVLTAGSKLLNSMRTSLNMAPLAFNTLTKWTDLREGHVYSFARQADGSIEKTMMPLRRLLPQKTHRAAAG